MAAFRLCAAVTLSAGLLGSPAASPELSLHPGVVALGERATAVIEGWRGSQLEVELFGATDARGRLLGWRSAHRLGFRWTAELPAPALRGIYPLLLRERAGGLVVRSHQWLLRVFRGEASREPSFAAPREVVRWWVVARAHSTFAVMRGWRLPAFDKRDPKLHRLYVVAYNPQGRPGVANRLGMFITVVRDGYDGRWRLLESTVKP